MRTGSKNVTAELVQNTWSDAARQAAAQARKLHGGTAEQHLKMAAAHRAEVDEQHHFAGEVGQRGMSVVHKEHKAFARYHEAAAAHLQGKGPAPEKPVVKQMMVGGMREDALKEHGFTS